MSDGSCFTLGICICKSLIDIVIGGAGVTDPLSLRRVFERFLVFGFVVKASFEMSFVIATPQFDIVPFI
jgi:hypothetical protein